MGYSISNKEMGRRLSIARKIAGKELDDSAKVIGVSANRLAMIEKGGIPLLSKEIRSLAYYYGTSKSRLFTHDAIHTDLVPRFKKHTKTEDKHVFEAAKLLNSLFPVEVELENILDIEHATNFPKGFDIGKGVVKEMAVEHAKYLRSFLKLGIGPIPDIFSVIENKLGIRLYQRKLNEDSKILGMFAFDEKLGACILLNAKYPRPSRVIAAAHELGHFMADRKKTEVLAENNQNDSRDERYAVNFSYALTMPKESFQDSFFEISGGSNKLSKKIVIELADKFNVPVLACVRQLEEYGLSDNAKCWYESVGELTSAEKRKILGSERYRKRYAEVEDSTQIVPLRIGLLAHRAWKNVFVSEMQLSTMLRLGLLEIRNLLYEIENGSPN